jgi:hypothetical protein
MALDFAGFGRRLRDLQAAAAGTEAGAGLFAPRGGALLLVGGSGDFAWLRLAENQLKKDMCSVLVMNSHFPPMRVCEVCKQSAN